MGELVCFDATFLRFLAGYDLSCSHNNGQLYKTKLISHQNLVNKTALFRPKSPLGRKIHRSKDIIKLRTPKTTHCTLPGFKNIHLIAPLSHKQRFQSSNLRTHVGHLKNGSRRMDIFVAVGLPNLRQLSPLSCCHSL